MQRRKLLGTLGSAIAGVAGCAGSLRTTTTSTATTTTMSTTSSQTATSATTGGSCADGGRLADNLVVTYDRLSGFDLTANRETVAQRGQITFRLENVTGEERISGNRSKYTIHRETESGWRDIFYTAPDSDQRLLYYDDGVIHQPGDGFTWEVTVSQSGLAHDIEEGHGSLAVCTPLQPGVYRFVYWGVTTDREVEDDSGTEYALGVRFSVSSD